MPFISFTEERMYAESISVIVKNNLDREYVRPINHSFSYIVALCLYGDSSFLTNFPYSLRDITFFYIFQNRYISRLFFNWNHGHLFGALTSQFDELSTQVPLGWSNSEGCPL